MKKLIWALGCLLVGAAVVPVSYYVQWSMRGSFLLEYDSMKKDCERVSMTTITEEMEETPEATLDAAPELKQEVYCRDLLSGIAAYRRAIATRSLGFGVVVFIGLLIVRFMMIPFGSAPAWEDDY